MWVMEDDTLDNTNIERRIHMRFSNWEEYWSVLVVFLEMMRVNEETKELYMS